MAENEEVGFPEFEENFLKSSKRFKALLGSTALESFSRYNSQVLSALQPYRSIQEQLASIAQPALATSALIENIQKSYLRAVGSLLPATTSLQEHLGLVSATAIWESQAKSLYSSIGNSWVSQLISSSEAFKVSHSSFFESIAEHSLTPEWADISFRLPTTDLAIHRQALQTFYPVADVEIDDELVIDEEDIIEFASETERNIASVSTDLLVPLQGAEQAISSRNPDKVRQAVTSMRELVSHVLRMITPDSEIRNWSEDEKYYHNGRPTRAARVAYLCRHSKSKGMKKLIETDMKSVNDLFDAFNGGTHKIVSEYSDHELRLLLCRTKSFLNYVILVAET